MSPTVWKCVAVTTLREGATRMNIPIRTGPHRTATPLRAGATAALAAALALQGTTIAAQEGALPPPLAGDLVLCIQNLVVEASPVLAAARATVEAARWRLEGAGLAPPAVVSAEIEDVSNGYDLSAATVRLEVGREYLTGGRTSAARALASADAGVVVVRMDALERRIRARTLIELSRLATARAVALRLKAQDALLANARASVTERLSARTARYVDILRVQTEQLRVRTEIAATVAEERAALEGLLGLVRADRTDDVSRLALSSGLADELAAVVTLPPLPALDSLVAAAAPVTLARAQEERTRAARAVVVAEGRTRFAASLGAQRFGASERGGASFGPVLGGSFTLPFTAGRANTSARRAAELDVDGAVAVLEAERSRVRGVVAGEMARYEAARERFEIYDPALLAAAREARESALGAYRTGDFSLVELLDFERAVATSEIERLRAFAAAVEAYTNLISGSPGTAGDAVEWSRQ